MPKTGILIGINAVNTGCINEIISVWVPFSEPAEITIPKDRPITTPDCLLRIEVSDVQCDDSEPVLQNDTATLVSRVVNCPPDNRMDETKGAYRFTGLIDETKGLSCVKVPVAEPTLFEFDVIENVLEPL